MNVAMKTITLVAICVTAALFAATATATPPAPLQPSTSTLPASGSIALSWSEPTQCSDWYVNPDASRWEFACIWGSWEDDFWVEAYYWNEVDQQTQLFRYCGGSGWWPSFCCSVSPAGGMCDA
jgi:hypothetical protein